MDKLLKLFYYKEYVKRVIIIEQEKLVRFKQSLKSRS